MQGIDPLQGKRFLVRKRDGRIEEFNEARILLAIEGAFKAQQGLHRDASLPDHAQAAVKICAGKVVERVLAGALRGEELEVEHIQDTVEDQLMQAGHLEVARRYILYREQRRLARVERESRPRPAASEGQMAGSPAAALGSILPELGSIYREALPKLRDGERFEDVHRRHFDGCLNEGDYWRRLSPKLLEYDSDLLARAMRLERDQQFSAARLEVLRERYLLREDGRCFETPQYFWMRIAMGLALREDERHEERALDFYEALSTFRFIPSDLILTHAGTPQPSLAGGGEDNSSSLWMEPWRRDFLEALDAQRPLLPDLFMKRVRQNGLWSLFDPAETGDLADCCGSEFEKRYLAYEQKAKQGAMRFVKQRKAVELWHEIVGSVARTAQAWLGSKSISSVVRRRADSQTRQAWLGFKDAMGLRSPRALHESAACPLGAINLAAHVSQTTGELDVALLRGTITAAVRMLDNAVDLNLYPDEQARCDGLEHRAIGLGIAGFQQALPRLQLKNESAGAAYFAGRSMELVSCCAITASAELARARGAFPGYADSTWREGILPVDTFVARSQERGLRVDGQAESSQDWASVREMIRLHGVRNGAINTLASLETPARIAGVSPSVDGAVRGKEADPEWLIECAARRQKWMDTPQPLTLHTWEKDLGQLAELYMQAWEKGISAIHQHCLGLPQANETKTVEMAAVAS